MFSKITSPHQKSVSYPCLMKSINFLGRIVLFTEPKKGTIVNETTAPTALIFDLGYYSDEWVMSYFKPYDGSVTLSNQPIED